MSRRVIIGPNGLKISRAGADAATATGADLLFDSDGSIYNGFYLSGRLLSAAFAETSQGVPNGGTLFTRNVTLVFGKTFPGLPRVFLGVLDPNNQGLFTPNFNVNSVAQGSTSGQTDGAALSMVYSVSQTQLFVTVSYLYYSGSGFNRFVDVAYLVFAA